MILDELKSAWKKLLLVRYDCSIHDLIKLWALHSIWY